jgi:ubiquinone/menaquinone biosynthesis C-methylase UbiE
MSQARRPIERDVIRQLSFAARDLATRDKIPVIQDLIAANEPGLAVDIGSGTGFTTYSVFGERPTVCIDVEAANLRWYRDRVMAVPGARRPLCVVALATSLPLKSGVTRYVLCSEVLEHLDDDSGAVGEMARVLAPGGRAVVTVPYTGLGSTSFLERMGILTVHDFPGPERHVRRGYDEATLGELVERRGLVVERTAFFLRLFTRLAADAVSLLHLTYQRTVHGRRAWTWAQAATAQGGVAFRLYTLAFPLLRGWSCLDVLLGRRRGFGVALSAVKPSVPGA